jgi:hypothetical protein
MFEEDGNYANRIGRYSVLEINDPKMLVRYENGSTADLNINIQYRIWENIVAEETVAGNKANQNKNSKSSQRTQFFVRPVNSLTADSLNARGVKEQITLDELAELKVSQGDRLIYYAMESQVYFAVGTITGEAAKPTARDKRAGKGLDKSILLLPVEVDARAGLIESAVPIDSIEFESQPDIKEMLVRAESFISISEDDFELLVEPLTEATEEEDKDEVEIEDDDEFDG